MIDPALSLADDRGNRSGDGVPDAVEVGLDDVAVELCVARVGFAHRDHAGVGDHDVDLTELLDAGGDGGPQFVE